MPRRFLDARFPLKSNSIDGLANDSWMKCDFIFTGQKQVILNTSGSAKQRKSIIDRVLKRDRVVLTVRVKVNVRDGF